MGKVLKFRERKPRASDIEIKNPYLYKKMLDILKTASDEKLRHISIETYKYFAKQISYITAKDGVKYWNKEKDIETISYIIDQLAKHFKIMPYDTQNLASDIFNDILEIKRYEEEGPMNEITVEDIRHVLKRINERLEKLKS